MRTFGLALVPLLALGSIAVGSIARADAVDPPPASCPPGSTPQSSHAGPICSPSAECTDTSCAAGATCDSQMQCVETRACGGRFEPDSAPCTLQHVVGPCAADRSCATGACMARRVCSSPSSGSGGCSCRVSGAQRSGLAALSLLALALLLAVRRRVRSHPVTIVTP